MVFEELYDEVLLKNEEFGKQNRPDGPKERYSPTDMGGCKRKIALQFFDSEKDVEEDDNIGRRILKFGNVIHNELQDALRQSFTELKSEMYFRVPLNDENKDITFSGYVDSLAFIPEIGIIAIEYKSINTFALKYVPEGGKPEHISQLNMYLHYFGIDKGLLVYYSKNDSLIQEHKIKYDPELAKRDIDWVIDLQRNYIDKLILPEKDSSYTKSKFPCSYCKYKSICYDGKDWKSEHYNKLLKEKKKDDNVTTFDDVDDDENMRMIEEDTRRFFDTFPDGEYEFVENPDLSNIYK